MKLISRLLTGGATVALALVLAACGDAPATSQIAPVVPVAAAPAATVVPQAIAEMAAPDPTDAPADVQVDAPAASSDASAPCAAGQLKGNRKSHIFHAPGQRDYAKVHADVACFDTADQATSAGYRAAKR